jgi:hypothetical protein
VLDTMHEKFTIVFFYFYLCILIFQSGVIKLFHTCTYSTLIRLTLLTAFSPPSTFQKLSLGFIMLSSYKDTMYFVIVPPSSSFSSPFSLFYSNSPTITIILYVSVHICTILCIHTYTHTPTHTHTHTEESSNVKVSHL